MTELLGPRPGEELNILREADMWMEKWQLSKANALMMYDGSKLLEFWQKKKMCFHSFDSLMVCSTVSYPLKLLYMLTMNLSVYLFFKLSLISKVPNVHSATYWITLPAYPRSIYGSRCPNQNSSLQNLVFLYSSPQLSEIESSELFSVPLSP